MFLAEFKIPPATSLVLDDANEIPDGVFEIDGEENEFIPWVIGSGIIALCNMAESPCELGGPDDPSVSGAGGGVIYGG
jgi:hypothetical protein